MHRKHFKISILMIFFSFSFLGFIFGCKNSTDPLGHQGPFDVPTATPSGPFSVDCVVNYGGIQTGVSWNLVDPNGNTVNTTSETTGGTPLSFTPNAYGVYTVNVPTQGKYFYSSQPLTITASGNYSVTFSCSGQTLSTNPTSINYPSASGYQMPVTIKYTSNGNLNVPVSVVVNGLPSAFTTNPSYAIINNGNSATVTLVKNTGYINSLTLNFVAYDLSSYNTGGITNLNLNRGYTIPVTITINNSLYVWSNYNGPIYERTPVVPEPTPNGGVNSDSICTVSYSFDPSVAGGNGVTISATFSPENDGSNGGGNLSGASFSMNGISSTLTTEFAGGFFASRTTPSGNNIWNFTITGPTGVSSSYQFMDGGCSAVNSCTNSTNFMNNVVINY